MIKIKKYKVSRRGMGGFAITLPKVWIDDVKLYPGDYIAMYRDEEDRLILVPEKK